MNSITDTAFTNSKQHLQDSASRLKIIQGGLQQSRHWLEEIKAKLNGFQSGTLPLQSALVEAINSENNDNHFASQPDFLGIGAQKAGTTWLYENLKRHPQINFPVEKETHFWDRDDNYRKGAPWWLNLFQKSNPEIKQGEITPAYAFLERSVIQEIFQNCPNAKILYSLRNPIDRAWSAARMMIERCEMQVHEASDQWFVDLFHSQGSLKRGDYINCIENWTSVFPKSQLQIILFDDIVKIPRTTLDRVAEHLEITPNFFQGISDEVLNQPVSKSIQASIRPSLLSILHKIYDDQIDQLSQLIDRDLSDWKSVK